MEGLDWHEKFVELLFALEETVILLNLVVTVILPAGGLNEDEFLKKPSEYKTFNEEGVLLNEAYTLLVFVNAATQKPIPAPADFLRILQ